MIVLMRHDMYALYIPTLFVGVGIVGEERKLRCCMDLPDLESPCHRSPEIMIC